VFHPSYRGLQATAAAQLGQPNLTIIKGGGGEFERHPGKDIAVFGLRSGAHIQDQAAALPYAARRLHDAGAAIDVAALWSGAQADPFAIDTVTGTAALALWTLHAAPDIPAAEAMAQDLWTHRLTRKEKCA